MFVSLFVVHVTSSVMVSFCVLVFWLLVLQVMAATHGVYQALLSLKNIPTLEAAYKLVLGEMSCSLASLLAPLELGAQATPPCTSPDIQHPAFASVRLSPERAEFTLIFDLGALTTIGNTKNSLIGVRHLHLGHLADEHLSKQTWNRYICNFFFIASVFNVSSLTL